MYSKTTEFGFKTGKFKIIGTPVKVIGIIYGLKFDSYVMNFPISKIGDSAFQCDISFLSNAMYPGL